jgi:hypothetical protein
MRLETCLIDKNFVNRVIAIDNWNSLKRIENWKSRLCANQALVEGKTLAN